MYNPYDVLLLLRRGRFAAHWFQTGYLTITGEGLRAQSPCVQEGEERSRRARNSAPVSHRTSQSPISANRSGSVIGANTSVRRAAVSAPKRAAAMPAQERPLLVNTLFDPLFEALFASFRKTLLASFPQPLLGPLGCPFDQRHPDLLQRPHRRHHRARRRHPLGDLPHPIDERALQLRRARIL